MIVKKFICGPLENNTYVLICKQTKKAAVIDPSFGSYDKIMTYSDEKYLLDKILLTHAHWDHIADVKLVKEKFKALICIHKSDSNILESPQVIPGFSFVIQGIKPDILLEDNQTINVGNLKILTIHTPGHTPGSSCFYIKKEKALFSGDTLFKGSFGRVDFPLSNPKDMIQSLKKLSKLSKDVSVYPGHGSETKIGKENWMENVEEFIEI